jgi:hypothetical protein
MASKRNSDFDDDDFERPRKKRRKKKAPAQVLSRGQVQLLMFAVPVFILLLSCGLYGIWQLIPSRPDKVIAGVNWYQAREEPNWTVTALFPGKPAKYEKVGIRIPVALAQLANQNPDDISWSIKMWTQQYQGREYSIQLFSFPKTGMDRGQMMEIMRQKIPAAFGPNSEGQDCKLGELPARRVFSRGPDGTQLSVVTGNADSQLFHLSVSDPKDFDLTDPLVAAFLENITAK